MDPVCRLAEHNSSQMVELIIKDIFFYCCKSVQFHLPEDRGDQGLQKMTLMLTGWVLLDELR